MNKNWFWIFTAGLILILVICHIGQIGMFLDGQQYATVAMNLANGKGTFWFPHVYSSWESLEPGIFLEQPQLGFYIEYWWFKILGNHFNTERIFCYSMLLLTAWLMHLIWVNITDNKNSWLAICIWILIPTCFWAYDNNVMEIVMGVFTTASILFSILSLKQKKLFWLYFTLSTLMIFLAVFTKGLPGLFVLCTYVGFAVFTQQIGFKRAVFISLFQTLIVFSLFTIIYYSFADAKTSWDYYLIKRLLRRISSLPTTESRLSILVSLFNDLLLPLIISIILFIYNRKNKTINSLGILFLIIGLCGVLPIMLTKVQRGFYIVQTFPLFAIGFSLIIYNWLPTFYTHIFKKYFPYLSIIALLTGLFLTYKNFNTISRDQATITDITNIYRIIAPQKIITKSSAMENRYDVFFYFKRYHNVDLYFKNSLTATLPYTLTYHEDSIPYQSNKILYQGKDLILIKN